MTVGDQHPPTKKNPSGHDPQEGWRQTASHKVTLTLGM
jgi:hypothetical protein